MPSTSLSHLGSSRGIYIVLQTSELQGLFLYSAGLDVDASEIALFPFSRRRLATGEPPAGELALLSLPKPHREAGRM